MTTIATVAGTGAASASPPPVAVLERTPDWVAAKALTYLCLASVGVAAASFVDLAWAAGFAYGVGYPVVRPLLKLSVDAVLFGFLLALVVTLVADLRVHKGMMIRKIPQESKWGSALRDAAMIAWLVSLPFLLLSIVGYVVMIVLPPADGSLTAKVCKTVFDVWVASSLALYRFVRSQYTLYGAKAVEDVAGRRRPCT